jgi:hypothetical protein
METSAMSGRRDWRLWLLFAVTAVGVTGVALQGPIPQDPAYHQFADQRMLSGIPNFWNVASNIAFLLVGIAGLASLRSRHGIGLLPPLRMSYAIFFVGAILVGFGSAYYHWHPNDATLVWDRLPMTVAFMALFSIIIGEHIHTPVGRHALIPLLAIGAASIFWWWLWADLRLYVLVQFLPVILTPLIVALFPSRLTHAGAMWGLFGAYAAAKALEFFDRDLEKLIGFSGHPLKHVVAAAGMGVLVLAIRRREIKPT